jgi:DNA helicase-2/ATP-dependent DNA helicase PcrA
MSNVNLAQIKNKIYSLHCDDKEQLEVIFSDSKRLMVEAPAGYGKTTTMISRIAYLYAASEIPNPKRILALTFSVNAALKIKRGVAETLPSLLGSQNSPVAIGAKVTITNYHGFCKGIIKKYGHLISKTLLNDIHTFRGVGDSEIKKNESLKGELASNELQWLTDVEALVKTMRMPDDPTISVYNEIVIEKLLPLGYVTHNAIILFVLEIFTKYAEVKKFYQSYFSLIVVDEFQDTNCIAWALLDSIISDHTRLVFLGDPLQRIYGFIGALPGIMPDSIAKYKMTKVTLSKNYRFQDNFEMIKLDKIIRENAANCFAPVIVDKDIAELPRFWVSTQQDEAKNVTTKVQSLTNSEACKIAVLFKKRDKNAEIIEAEFINRKIPYFYGMFTDEDSEYIQFHNKCREMFIERFDQQKTVNKKELVFFSSEVKSLYSAPTGKKVDALLKLLDALVEKVGVDYAELPPKDKYTFVLEIFENRQLKQAMEYVSSQVILSTIHGAKGLEWDYVIICDVEQWVFTFNCRKCPSNSTGDPTVCKLPKVIPPNVLGGLLEDLCVFYVAITRARKQVFISASAERFNANESQFTNGRLCCLASIDGIRLINAAP